jgi:hypothetical protein
MASSAEITGIQAAGQLARVALQIHQRLAGHAAFHRRLGDGGGDAGDQPGVEGVRDDVLGAEAQALAAAGTGHFLRHILARQHGQRLGGGDLHGVVDGAGAHIQRAAEDVGEAEDVIDLVRVVAAACGDDARLGARHVRRPA